MTTAAESRVHRERFLEALQAMTGKHVKLTLKDKPSVSGIFHTVSQVNSDSFDYVLKGAKTQDSVGQWAGRTGGVGGEGKRARQGRRRG